jgi:TP901 family phage tail tape measure protein
MEVLIKNGLDMAQVLGGATDASLALAGATGSELASAADVATDVLQSFSKQVGDLKPAVDQITGTLLASKFGFDDYRLALGQAGGVAGGLGVEFEDFNAVLAATSNLFSSGSDAGTSFKTFLTRLTPTSKQAAAAIEEYGLEFFDAAGNMRSMGEVAEELRTKLGQLSEERLNDVLKTIFGVDALRTAIGLMRQGADGVERLRSAIAQGNAEEQAAARLQGLNGALEQLSSAVETLSIRIAEAGLIDVVTDLVKGFTDFVKELSTTSPEMLAFATKLAVVAAAIGPVLIGLGLMASGVSALLTPVRLAINGFIALAAKIGVFKAALVSTGLGAVIVGIGAGIGYWATYVSDATAALRLHEGVVGDVEDAYRKAGFEVAKMTQEVRDRLTLEARESLTKLRDAFKTTFEDVSQRLFELRRQEGVGPLVQDFIDGKSSVEDFAAALTKIGLNNPELQKGILQILEITKPLEDLSAKINRNSDELALLEGHMSDAAYQAKYYADEQRALARASEDAGKKVTETAQAVEKLGQSITVHSGKGGDSVKRVYDLVDGVAKATEDSKASLEDVSASAEKAGEKVGRVKDDITALMVSVPEELRGQQTPADVLTEGLDGAKQQLTETLSTIPAEAKTAVDGLVAEVGRVQPAVAAAIGGGADAAQGAGGGTAASGIAEALTRPFEDARARIAAALAEIAPVIVNTFAAVNAAASEQGASLGDALVAPFDIAAARIAAILERMVSAVKANFQDVLSAVRSLTSQLQAAVSQLESLARRAEAAAARAQAASASASGRANGGPVGNGGGGFAGGGKVSGPGTGTSDSILSWLSDGEFVLRARAVRKYGLGLLYALNNMQLPKDFFKGFAGGGHVDLSGIVSGLTTGMRVPSRIPALAGGGPAPSSGGRPLTLVLDGQRYELLAPEDTADSLAKHASRQRLRVAGKAPSWSTS